MYKHMIFMGATSALVNVTVVTTPLFTGYTKCRGQNIQMYVPTAHISLRTVLNGAQGGRGLKIQMYVTVCAHISLRNVLNA